MTGARRRILLSVPHMSGREEAYVREAFATNWVAPLGPNVDAFEAALADFLGGGEEGGQGEVEVAALSSGTAALHLALVLAGVGPGDLVLASDLTFVATVNPIRYVGATPVLVDADEATWNLDPHLLEEALRDLDRQGKRPRALVVAHLFGVCADMDPILALCRERGVVVIEDAAEALGATYRGRPAGTMGDFGVFSFNGNKVITTSGGGALTARDPALVRRARFLATQARDPAPHYQHSVLGYNYRMSNVVAGVGRGQMEVLRERVEARRANFAFYCGTVGRLPGVRMMPSPAYGRHLHWLSCCTIAPDEFGCDRTVVMTRLDREHDIETRPVWKPMHLQPLYSDARCYGGSVGERLFEHGLCLPSSSSLTQEDLARVAAAVEACSGAFAL